VAQALACVSGISGAGYSPWHSENIVGRKNSDIDLHHYRATDLWKFEEPVESRRHRLKPVPLKTNRKAGAERSFRSHNDAVEIG